MSLIMAVCLTFGVMVPAALADETKTFIVAMTEDPKSFNPDAQADDSGWPVFQNLYDGPFQLSLGQRDRSGSLRDLHHLR